MSPTISNKLALQGVVNKLSLADAMILRDAFTYSSILEQCYSTRVDPVFYLSKTFKHPVTLLSAMFDTGCILVGSRALEFFVPGSSRDESAWKFFVPGYKESVSDMINALDKSGVAWHFDNPTAGHEFTTLYGRLHPSKGAQQVQLIIGNDRDDLRGGMSFLKEVYASHVQCFISGWCAAHMHYGEASTKTSTIWRQQQGQERLAQQPDTRKYELRGFRLERACRGSPITRSFNDHESIVLDFGDMYRGFIQKSHQALLGAWLAERRQNIASITWTEFDGRICSVSDPFETRFRDCEATFITHAVDLPLNRLRRLANLVSLCAAGSDALRCDTFRSSVASSLATAEEFRNIAYLKLAKYESRTLRRAPRLRAGFQVGQPGAASVRPVGSGAGWQPLSINSTDANAFHFRKNMPTSARYRRKHSGRTLLLREVRSHRVTKQKLAQSDDKFWHAIAHFIGLQECIHALQQDNARLRHEKEHDKATIQKLVATEHALRHLAPWVVVGSGNQSSCSNQSHEAAPKRQI
ncbi:hypothetical protein PCL_07059 [Purpureocillium lilacinum]|uniref:Uncharacterized protein n=1 Tax=Purpureocillium lilacinum TaxID=33203 RepID=A0A2U3DT78_PURLI|nr:hypothetical protein PCL_07059 [Purpureocillium lilacinum]